MAGSASEAGARPAMSKTPARQRAAELEPIIRSLEQQGVTSLVELAKALNDKGIPTQRRRAKWTPVDVARLRARL
jgi:predicted flap endonuclease-1-like 5' DNA nuclease